VRGEHEQLFKASQLGRSRALAGPATNSRMTPIVTSPRVRHVPSVDCTNVMSVKLIQRLHDGCRRRAEVSFELGGARGARTEGLDVLWPAPPRAGEEASRSARCADRGRPPAATAEEPPGTATWNATIARLSPRSLPSHTQSSCERLIIPGWRMPGRVGKMTGMIPFLVVRQNQVAVDVTGDDIGLSHKFFLWIVPPPTRN
jgi:hypothetical protein